MADKKEVVNDKTSEVKKVVLEKQSDAKEKALEVKKGALEKTAEAKDKALMKKEEITTGAKEKSEEIKTSIQEKSEEIKTGIQEKSEEIEEDVSDKRAEFRENAEKTRKQAERKINEFINSLKDKQGELGKTISDYTAADKPLTDVIETEDSFIIKTDLPQVKKEDISVNITEDLVEINAKFADESEDMVFIKKERNYGEMQRTITLPALIEVKKASGKFKDFVLTLVLPKVQEEKIKIEIE